MNTPDFLKRAEINNTEQAIASLFDAAALPHYRKDIRHLVQAAYSCRIWKRSSPADFLYRMKLLESTINVAHRLNNKQQKGDAIRITKSEALKPRYYCAAHPYLTSWDYFPRLLTFKEFLDPGKAIARFFTFYSLAEWEETLQELVYYALSNKSIMSEGEYTDGLELYIHLVKMIEALHLVFVRGRNDSD